MKLAVVVVPALFVAGCADPADAPPPSSVSALHFTDVTAESGLAMTLTSGADPARQILEVKGGGLALIDVDGDGDLDVFVPNGATLESPDRGPGARLFVNAGGLRFRDATQEFGITYRGWGMGVAVADVDADGFDDIAITAFGPDVLLRNVGGERFEQQTLDPAEAWSMGASFGDVDGDGDLDLYVSRYLDFDIADPPERMMFKGVSVFGGPVGLDPQPDVLWLNAGDGTFVDASDVSGIRDVAPAFGLGALIIDVDADGAQEIFVGNDSAPNLLFDTPPGASTWHLRDRATAAGIAANAEGANQATMGIAVGDVDGNGRPDLFTTNFSSDTNTLHVNADGEYFDDRTARLGLKVGSHQVVGWATAFVDVDHDGDEDVIVFNGHTYAAATRETMDSEARQPPLLYERSDARFERVTPDVGGAWLAEAHMDRGAAFGDLDGDGDIDIVVGECNGPLRVLRNDGAPGAWLIVALEDGRPASRNRRGIGARVVVRAGERVFTRWIFAGGSYLSASATPAHVGLGEHVGPVEVEVTWPDMRIDRVTGVTANQRLVVTRGN